MSTLIYRIEEGYSWYNNYPLYRVVGINNYYSGEWGKDYTEINAELDDLS